MEGRYFPLPLQVASCPVPRSLWMHGVRSRLLHNFGYVGHPVFGVPSCLLGGTGRKVVMAECGERGLGDPRMLPRAAAFPSQPPTPPMGRLPRLPVEAGVTTVYQCPQPECQTISGTWPREVETGSSNPSLSNHNCKPDSNIFGLSQEFTLRKMF